MGIQSRRLPRKPKEDICTQGPHAHFSAEVQGLDLVLRQWYSTLIPAGILQNVVYSHWFQVSAVLGQDTGYKYILA